MSVEQGHVIERGDPDFLESLCATVSYRGDVTIDIAGGESVEGYVYDVDRLDDAEHAPRIRMLPADGSSRRTIEVDSIERISVTGRDTAAGRSFEAWMKRYVERKRLGLPANIEDDEDQSEGASACASC